MRIGIDCYPMQDRASAERGIGRYARDLTRALVDAAPDDTFILYAIAGKPFHGLPRGPGPRRGGVQVQPIRDAPRINPLHSEALDVHLRAGGRGGNPDRLDVLLTLAPVQSHVRRGRSSPRLVAVHYDLIPEVFPAIYLRDAQTIEAYESSLVALRGYDAIVTMSAHARADLIARRGFAPEAITVAGAAANPHFGPLDPEADGVASLQARGIYGRYILNVGHTDPRKGTVTLADAFARLDPAVRAGVQLVFAYACGPVHQQEIKSRASRQGLRPAVGDPALLHALGLDSPVVFTGWIDEGVLRTLYQHATVMCFPSLYEGFGLPILEAMQCGTPVIAGDNSSQPEVAAGTALLVDAADPGAIAQALTQILTDPAAAAALAARGRAAAAERTWPAVAARVLSVLRNA